MYPMRSLSEAILDVVAKPRAVMILADSSCLENMSWSGIENKWLIRIARLSVTPQSDIIIDDTHIASDPVHRLVLTYLVPRS